MRIPLLLLTLLAACTVEVDHANPELSSQGLEPLDPAWPDGERRRLDSIDSSLSLGGQDGEPVVADPDAAAPPAAPTEEDDFQGDVDDAGGQDTDVDTGDTDESGD